MDKQLTSKLQAWLALPANQRDIETGRMLILQLTRSQVLAINFARRPATFMPHVEYQLNKHLSLRIQNATHATVVEMRKQAKTISTVHKLDAELPGPKNAAKLKRIEKTDEFQKGKRTDHDSLPEDIKQCYADNLDLMRRMRECHTRIAIFAEKEATNDPTICKDSDIYPFLQELIECDKQYHANWEKYDAAPKA